jgi:transcription-repair coupling factor (superfamily II helicase)
LREIQVEMIDRFGLLSDPIKNLFTQAGLRIEAQRLGLTEIDATTEGGSIEFSKQTTVEPIQLIRMIQSDPTCFSLSGQSKLKFKRALPTLEDRCNFVEELLARMAPDTRDQQESKSVS